MERYCALADFHFTLLLRDCNFVILLGSFVNSSIPNPRIEKGPEIAILLVLHGTKCGCVVVREVAAICANAALLHFSARIKEPELTREL